MRCCTLIWIFILICAIATLPENLQISPGVAAGDDVEHMEANVTTAKQMVDSNPLLVILDVQETPDYLAGHIRNAISIPLSELEERIGELDPDRETLVYAESGYGSSEATNILTENGFINIYDMCCGIRGWSDAGYPVYKKYPSVMAAVNGVPVGASVFLSSGTYNGDFTINKTISLIGENRTSTIVEDSAYGACINVSSDGTLISSLTIRGGDIGIISFSGSRNEFSNCTFTDLKTAVSLYSSTYGVLRNNIMFESGLSVEGNLLEHWSTHSVDGTNMVNGKPLYYATQLTHMEISDDSGQIILVNCSNVSISNRDFNSNNIGITLGFSSNIQINKNTFYSNGNHGISLYRSNNNIIIYNTFESNGDQGIYLENSSHNTIKQNLIKDNGGYGVSQVRGYNNNIFNNTFIRNNDGRIQAFDGSDNSSWYDGVYGNYWSDYSQKYPDALNDTRVWDTPYLTNGPAGASDRYPAVAPTVALSSYPVTDAGPDINAAQNTVVIFDGSHSFDSLGINNFTWNFHYGNKQMVLYGITPTYIFERQGYIPEEQHHP